MVIVSLVGSPSIGPSKLVVGGSVMIQRNEGDLVVGPIDNILSGRPIVWSRTSCPWIRLMRRRTAGERFSRLATRQSNKACDVSMHQASLCLDIQSGVRTWKAERDPNWGHTRPATFYTAPRRDHCVFPCNRGA